MEIQYNQKISNVLSGTDVIVMCNWENNMLLLFNEKSKMKYDFNLSYYYNKETRIFEFPKGYVEFSLMSDVFNTLLFPLDLVEKVEA